MAPTSSRARLSSSPRRGRGSASRASASSSRASVFGPMPGTSAAGPAAAASRSSSAVRTPSARASSIERLRAQPEVAPEADELGRELALELGQLGDLARLDELAQPRLDPRADPAQLAHPPVAHELGDRERPRRGSSRPRGGRRGPCTGSPRRARAATRTRPGDRRSRRLSTGHVQGRPPFHACQLSISIHPLTRPRSRLAVRIAHVVRGEAVDVERGRGRRRGSRARAG